VHLSMYIKSYDYIVGVFEKYLSHWKAAKNTKVLVGVLGTFVPK
jgi:hypothetical protein